MFPHLKGHGQRVNLQLLQEAACRELVQHLERIEGSKVIVLDEAMIGPLDLVTRPKLFADRGIRLLALKPELHLPREVANVVYVVRPRVALMEQELGVQEETLRALRWAWEMDSDLEA